MTITPAIKGQITRRAQRHSKIDSELPMEGCLFRAAFDEFQRYMPRQQAKHAARKYVVAILYA